MKITSKSFFQKQKILKTNLNKQFNEITLKNREKSLKFTFKSKTFLFSKKSEFHSNNIRLNRLNFSSFPSMFFFVNFDEKFEHWMIIYLFLEYSFFILIHSISFSIKKEYSKIF